MSCTFPSMLEHYQKTRISFSFLEGLMKETLGDGKTYCLAVASGTEACLKEGRISAGFRIHL